MATIIPDGAETAPVKESVLLSDAFQITPAFVTGTDEDGVDRIAPSVNVAFKGKLQGDPDGPDVEIEIGMNPLALPDMLLATAQCIMAFSRDRMVDFAKENGWGEEYSAFLAELQTEIIAADALSNSILTIPFDPKMGDSDD